jgi:hypothetical protein
MDRFQLKKRGSAAAADGVYMQAGYFDDVMKRNITNAMGKARSHGFAPGDMLINKFHVERELEQQTSFLRTPKSVHYLKILLLKTIAH